MNYHDRIINLTVEPMFERDPTGRATAYRNGHRDARHAAAEIAIEADKVIADLLEALEDAMRWFAKLEDWRGVGDPDIDRYRAAIAKAKGEQQCL